jgi:hypothetical protein
MSDLVWWIPPDQQVDIETFGEYWMPYYKAQTVPFVAKSLIHTGEFMVEVSTVFLSVDHAPGDWGPVLWESMTFGGPLDHDQTRHYSPEGASAGHVEMLRENWIALDLDGTPELVTVTYHGKWWRDPGRTGRS